MSLTEIIVVFVPVQFLIAFLLPGKTTLAGRIVAGTAGSLGCIGIYLLLRMLFRGAS